MTAKTAAERQRQWRQRRKDAGWMMATVWLEPDVADALETASDGKQSERQRLITECLRKYLFSTGNTR